MTNSAAPQTASSSGAPAPTELTQEALTAAAMKILTTDPRFKVGEAEIRGNSYRVFENAPASLVDLFRFGAAAHGEKDFIVYEDEVHSFQGVWSDALKFANALRADYGIGKGDRVALAMRNYPEWCIAFKGILATGAVVVPLNAWWKTEELSYALGDCGAKLVIVDGKRFDLIEPVASKHGLTMIVARDARDGAASFADLLAGHEANDLQPDIQHEDDFAIYYTSGSTGTPKGVILTHRGCVTTLFSWGFIATVLKEARGGVSLFGDNPGILLAIPLFHVTGSHSIFLMSYLVGRRMAMMYRWDPVEACNLIRDHELTNFVGVPSQSYEMIDAAGEQGLPSLLDIGSGGAKRPPDHVRLLADRFKGANPSSGYGLTETNAIGCVNTLADYRRKPDSTGKAVPPCCDIKIVGDDGDAATGEVGEIWIRSAGNFRGYLNRPEDTEKALTPDGWFRTGDLGRLDDEGFLFIVDRMKDIIIRAGENISCLEVEAAAYEFGAVGEAIVFSVPDDVLGERVGLVVHPKQGTNIDLEELRQFMGKRLAGFKVPERMWVSPMQLPRLGTAKFDKITIRRIALQNEPQLSV